MGKHDDGERKVGKMNKASFEKLVEKNLAWLQSMPSSVERSHIIMIVKDSPTHYYPEKEQEEDKKTFGTAISPSGKEVRVSGLKLKPSQEIRCCTGCALQGSYGFCCATGTATGWDCGKDTQIIASVVVNGTLYGEEKV